MRTQRNCIHPKRLIQLLVHKEKYNALIYATAYPKGPELWSGRLPFPSSIGLVSSKGRAIQNFNEAQAKELFQSVNAKVAGLIKEDDPEGNLAGFVNL